MKVRRDSLERKTKEMRMKKQMARKAWLGMMAALLVLTFGLLLDGFSQVAMAATQGKITASSVNVRKEASASSTAVAGAKKDDVVTVNGQTTGSDGKVWYKVEVDGVVGYIRSDLMSVTEGDVPDTTNEPTAVVTDVEPISGKVTGGQLIRVRGDASTDSRIVTTVAKGAELTIVGEATGTDNKIWYKVNFAKDGAQVTGFIREDFVNPSGNIVPVTAPQDPEDPVEQPQDPVVQPQEPVVQETKAWETSQQNETWYLIDNVNAKKYEINDMLQGAATNAQLYYDSQDTVKAQKVAIIVLVILLLGVIGVAAFVFYKIKDESDAAYINAVERETLNRRSVQASSRPEGRPTGRAEAQKVMHNVGPDKKSTDRPGSQSGQRPAPQPGQRPTGQPGQRPAPQPGQRPAPQPGQRPTGQPGQRPAPQPGQRPAPQPGQRPAPQPGQRPAPQPGQRPAAQPVQRPQSSMEEGGPVTQERETRQAPNKAAAEGNWKSKNFMTDEDEFEFDFLNWDGSEEQ